MPTSLLFSVGISISISLVFLCLTVLFRLCLKYRYRLRLTPLNTAITKNNNKIDENTNFRPIDFVDFRKSAYRKSHISPIDLGLDWSKILPKKKKLKSVQNTRNKRRNHYFSNKMKSLQTDPDCLNSYPSKTLRFSPTVYTIIHAKNVSEKNNSSHNKQVINEKSENMKTSSSAHHQIYTCNKYGYRTTCVSNQFVKTSLTSSGSGSESKIGDSTMDEMDDEDAMIFAASKLESPEN